MRNSVHKASLPENPVSKSYDRFSKSPSQKRLEQKKAWKKDLAENWVLYLIFIPTAIYFFIFNYIPMSGIVMAFQDVSLSNPNLLDNPWVGWGNFEFLFSSGDMFQLIRNTGMMVILNMTIGFVIPIVLAFVICEIGNKYFRRFAQIVTYMPYFLSAVIIAQLVKTFVGDNGAVTKLLELFGYTGGDLLNQADPPVFWFVNLLADVWQNAGYSSIVYVAAIMNVDKNLHEAAALDGANRMDRILKITLPSIMPMIMMMFTIKIGTVLNSGFDKVVLLYNDSIRDTADCLYSYTYRMRSSNTSLSAAAGLFQSVVSTAMLLISNWLTKKTTKSSLF